MLLHLVIFYTVFDPPTIIPSGVVDVREGQSLTLSCDNFVNQTVSVSWSHTHFLNKSYDRGPFQLSFSSIMRNNSGLYTCRVIFIVGGKMMTQESSVTLNVQCKFVGNLCSISYTPTPSADPPSVDLPTTPIIRQRGSNLSLPCQFDGNPTPKITWLMNGTVVNINNSVGRSVEVVGNSSVLHILSLDVSDSGHYICIAENSIGVDPRLVELHGKDQYQYFLSMSQPQINIIIIIL